MTKLDTKTEICFPEIAATYFKVNIYKDETVSVSRVTKASHTLMLAKNADNSRLSDGEVFTKYHLSRIETDKQFVEIILQFLKDQYKFTDVSFLLDAVRCALFNLAWVQKAYNHNHSEERIVTDDFIEFHITEGDWRYKVKIRKESPFIFDAVAVFKYKSTEPKDSGRLGESVFICDSYSYCHDIQKSQDRIFINKLIKYLIETCKCSESFLDAIYRELHSYQWVKDCMQYPCDDIETEPVTETKTKTKYITIAQAKKELSEKYGQPVELLQVVK